MSDQSMENESNLENLKQYECGQWSFSDTERLEHYDRHLVFDHAVTVEEASQRERFEALARDARHMTSRTPNESTICRWCF